MTKIIEKISYVSVFLTIFAIPFYFFRFKIVGLPTNILEVLILISALLVVLELIIKKSKINHLPLWAYLFVLSTAVGWYLADDKTQALGIIKGWFILPLIFGWLVLNKIKKQDYPKIAWAFLISAFVVALWAIFQKAGVITTLFYQKNDPSFDQYLMSDFRVFGPFESPNYLAMFLVPVCYLSLPILESTKSKILHFFIYFCWFFVATAIMLSGSRAGIIALFLSPVIFILATGKVGNIRSLFLRVSFIGVAFFALFMAIIIYGLNPGSDSIRLEIYKYSFDLIQLHPYFGIGLGNFQASIAAISVGVESFRVFALPYALHPHNLFLAIWLYQGALGLIFFLFLLISFISRVKKNLKFELSHAGYSIALLAIIFHGLFDTTYFKNDLSVIFWLVIAFGLIISPKSTKKKVQIDKTGWWQEIIDA